MRRHLLLSVIFGLLPVTSPATTPLPTITMVLPASAASAERWAFEELHHQLQRLYPDERFGLADTMPDAGRAIVLASRTSAPGLISDFVSSDQLQEPESYRVIHRHKNGQEIALIAGADSRGTSYAVYALLEKLGCGFYLSYQTAPPPRAGPLSFGEWELADRPLVADRLVLNWQNFLSSASSWELSDWERYIDASARMRFNDLMVHAYGNNPMFTFSFNGVTKPVGYIATTDRGRDWGTQHVNDVRQMIGGELFDHSVFGASVAKGDPAKRVEATTTLMQHVFKHARARGLGVTFALDVDTASSNPAEIINTLPATARFKSGDHALANPDTPEGYAYYKAQLEQLLALYPEITRVAVWFRDPTAHTPWRRLKREEMPSAWQREFTGPDDDVSAFALAKVVHAFRRALKESDRDDVTLAAGSWAFPFLEASDRYIAPEIPIIALDWWVSFDSDRAQRDLLEVRSGRKLLPIVWAHHDDRTYIGRPYTPFLDFATKLQRVGASGFGIIHWTTRPLDLYFENTIDQVWSGTANQSLKDACRRMAARAFGEPALSSGGDYLYSWVTEAPMFGRETSAHFIDHPLPEPEVHARLGAQRIEQLARIKALDLPAGGVERLDFFERYERFMLAFFESQTAVERAAKALAAGDYAKARAEILQAHPEDVIEQYVAAVGAGETTPGEKAIVVSLNLRWLPHVLSVRQAVGLEPVRYRLGEVTQEPLAQGAYPNSYYFDDQQRLWKVIDRATAPPVLRLTAISGDRLQPGNYVVSGLGGVVCRDGWVEVPLPAVDDEIVIRTASPQPTP